MSETAASPLPVAQFATFESFCSDPLRVDGIMREVYAKGDKLMCALVGLHLCLSVLFAAFYDTWLASFAIAGAAGLMFFLSVALLPRHRVTRVTAGIALQIFCALHIWQMHGMAEMHFFFFTAFTAMVAYQDGASMWPGTLLIIAQHILFAVLHNSGVNLYFFESSFVSISRLVFHFGIAILQVTLCGIWAHSLRNKALVEGYQRECLEASRCKLEEDMVARVAAERALAAREAEARLGIVASHTSNGVVIADSQGRIEWVNKAFEDLSGKRLSDVEGASRFSILREAQANPDTLERLREALFLRGEGVEELLVDVEGKPKWLFIQAKRVMVGDVNKVVCVEIDVTARKEVEAELEKARARAEDAARAKGDFLATMSHEMRTPLNGILGMSDILSRTSLNRRQAEQLETLRTCADNLLALVNDVLDLSKVEAGSLELEDAPFEPRALVDDVLAMNAVRAQGKRIELYAVVDRNVPETVLGDMTRTRQTLTNLVANAVKFTSDGEVHIRVALEDAVEHAACRLRFCVSDTGIGIDENTRSRLFAPFTQADGSISRRFGGSGLGLAISRRLVEAMGGAIDFESEYGKGSRFFFSLPCRASQKGPLESQANGKVALVASPHEGTRFALVELLAHRGYSVESATPQQILAAEVDVAIVDAAFSHRELKRLGDGTPPANLIWLTRPEQESPPWAQNVMMWPVRSAALEAAVMSITRPGYASKAFAARGLSWRSPPGTKVLVVEDNPVNQIVAQSILEDLGLSVSIAENGERALEILCNAQFDIVLMDCQMPVMDGFEATRRLRAREAAGGRRTPILALTAQALDGDEEACRRAGMDDYLTKPIERRLLIAKLERLLSDPLSVLEAVPNLLQTTNAPENDVSRSLAGADRAANRDVEQVESFLQSMREQVGDLAAAQIVTIFLRTVPAQVQALCESIFASSPSSVENLQKVAHSVRGAMRSVGLSALGDILETIERDLGKQPEAVARHADLVQKRLQHVCDRLAAAAPQEAVG